MLGELEWPWPAGSVGDEVACITVHRMTRAELEVKLAGVNVLSVMRVLD